jgi:hypothetical protein
MEEEGGGFFDWFTQPEISGGGGGVETMIGPTITDEQLAAGQEAHDRRVLAESQAELQDATMGYYTPESLQGGVFGPTISDRQLEENQAAYRERLDREREPYQFLEPGSGDFLRGGAPADPSGIDWWDRGFDATIGGLGRLSKLGAQGLQLKRMLEGADPAPVSRPQQVFTRAPMSGSPIPAQQVSLWPARWDGSGQPGVLRTNYQPTGAAGDITGAVFSSDAAKIVAYAVAAGLGVLLLKKLIF